MLNLEELMVGVSFSDEPSSVGYAESTSIGESVETDDTPASRLKRAVRNGESVNEIRSILETTQIHVEALVDVFLDAAKSSFLNSREPTDPDVLCALIEHNPETARIVTPDDGSTLVSYSCFHQVPTQVIRLLIERNPDALVIPEPHRGLLPIHQACRSVLLETIRLLVSHRPESIRARNFEGMLPLHMAFCLCAPEDVILYLIDFFPEGVRAENNSGRLPLHYVYHAPLQSFEDW